MDCLDNQYLLQQFVEYAPAAVAMFDRDMRYLVASRRWLNACGLGEQNIIGCYYYQLEHEITEGWQAIHQRVLGGAIEKYEQSLLQADGSIDLVKWEISPWYSRQGEIGGTIVSREAIAENKAGSRYCSKGAIAALRDENGLMREFSKISHDLTHYKQTEEHLHLLERAIAASTDGIAISDATQPDNPIIYINPRFEQMTGYSSAEVVGRNCRFLQGSDTDQPGRAELRAAIQEQKECSVVLRNYRKDGTLFWNELRMAPVRNAEGKVTNFVGVQTDITYRMEADEKLLRISKAVESASDAIIITNAKGRSVYHNQAFIELFEYTTDELNAAGGPAARYCDPNVASEVVSAITNSTSCWSGEVEMRTRSGRVLNILLRADAIADDNNNLVGLIGIHTDITGRKHAEQVLQQMLQRQQLLGAIGQRIRQSLNLDEVLNTAVAEVRQFLQTDRALLYRFEPDWSGTVVVESVAHEYQSVLGSNIKDPCFGKRYVSAYQNGRIRAIDDIYNAELAPCHVESLERFGVRANLVVPIMQGEELWGLLIAHHCQSSRHWELEEVELLRTLSVQMAIAIQQAALFEKLQSELVERKAAESALRDSEARLQAILDNSTAVIYVKDQQGRFLLVNSLFKKLFHLDRDQIIGKTNHEIFPHELADAFHANDQQVLRSGSALEWEEVAPVEDVLHTYLSVKFPLRDSAGCSYAVCGISTDITERKQSEQALRRSNSILKAQQEAAIDGILVIDEKRNITSYNHRFQEMWQIPDDLISSGDDRIMVNYVLSSLEDPEEFISKVEYLYTHPSESSRDEIYLKGGRVFDRYSAAVLSPQGEDYGRIWYFRDISDAVAAATLRKQVEADLQKSHKTVNNILESITDAFFSLDQEWRFTYVNSRAEQLFFKTKEQLIGKSIWDEFPETVGSIFSLRYHQAVADQATIQFEELYPPLNTWFQVRAYPYADGLSVYFHDINERKQREAARQENETRLRRQQTALMDLARCQPLYAGDLNAAWREITETAVSTLGVARASVWLYNGRSQGGIPTKIKCVDLYQLINNEHSFGIELEGVDYPSYFHALEAERVIAAHDAHTDLRTKEFSASYLSVLGVTSMLDVPIRLGGRTVGVLCLEHIGTQRQWGVEEENFANYLAYMAALAMEASDRLLAETALASSEAKFRTLVANIPGAVYSCACDSEWTMEFISEAIAEISGYPASDFIQNLVRTFASIVHPEDATMVERVVLEGVEARQPYIIEYRIIRADGTVRWVYDKGQAILDEGGALIRLDGAIFDITERKQAEENLRNLGAALENAVEGISRLDTSGRYIAVNKAYARAVGYEPEEMVGMQWTPTVHPEDLENLIAAYQKMLIDGKVEAQARGVRKDGSIFHKQVVMISVYDKQQRFIGHHCFMKDITQRKQAEEALRQSEILRQSEEKNRALLDAIPDSMYRIRWDGTYLDYRAAKNDNQALGADAVIGRNVHQMLPSQVAQQTMHYVGQALITGETQVFEYQVLDPAARDCEARVVANGADEVLAIVRDITERKKVERLKNEFVSIVSHELRTPLTSVRGSLSLILGGIAGEIPPDAKALVDIAYKNSERLILLINDILDIEKIESGKMDFNMKPLELMPLVEQAIEANRAYAEQLGVQLVVDGALPDVKVNVDRDRLIQVLTNLLSNAAKFSPHNGTVVVSVSRLAQAIRVTVSDRGSGIPEEFRPRIFQKFAQADSSATRQKGGTGLGLSISKAIIQKLGGQMGFETEINVGTSFYFELPEWYELSHSDTSDTSPLLPRILVCEDDRDIATLLSMMLQQHGVLTDIAYDAAEAKKLLAQYRYAAMTLDLALPDKDGISLIRELREDETTQRLPIIVVSAKALQGREELSGGGFAVLDWLDKPIDQGRLMSAVRQAVAQENTLKPHVLYVEDDPDLTQVVATILHNLVEIDSAKNLQQAKQKLKTKTFDLVMLDVSLPDGSGLELLPYLNNPSRPPIPAVVFSAKEVGMEAVQQVAAALVKSRTSNQQLLDTIKSLIGHGGLINNQQLL